MELRRASFTRTWPDCVNQVDSGSLLKRRLSSQNGFFFHEHDPSIAPQRKGTTDTQRNSENTTDLGVEPVFGETDTAIASVSSPPEPAHTVFSGRPSKRLKRLRQRPLTSGSDKDLESPQNDCKPKVTKRNNDPESSATGKTRKSPHQVKSACTRCQHRKAKCSGTRPSCKHCTERGLICSYDVAEGSTRTNDLKRKLWEATTRAHYFGCILAALRDSTDYEASQILARLRLGDSIPDILRTLPGASSSPENEPKLTIPER